MKKSKTNFRNASGASAVSPSKVGSTSSKMHSPDVVHKAKGLPATPPTSRVTSLFQSRVRDGLVSSATKRNKIDTQSTSAPSLIIHTITCDQSFVGVIVDGGYAASDFFTGRLSEYDLSLLVPYSNETLRRLDVPGGLLKASEAINILNDKPKDYSPMTNQNQRQELFDLEMKAPYVISQTGKNRGMSKVWVFSNLQLMEKHPENLDVDFEADVVDVITAFFTETKHTCDKDNYNKICVPSDVEEAIKIYDESKVWDVMHLTYDLDNDEKISAFAKLCSSF